MPGLACLTVPGVQVITETSSTAAPSVAKGDQNKVRKPGLARPKKPTEIEARILPNFAPFRYPPPPIFSGQKHRVFPGKNMDSRRVFAALDSSARIVEQFSRRMSS